MYTVDILYLGHSLQVRKLAQSISIEVRYNVFGCYQKIGYKKVLVVFSCNKNVTVLSLSLGIGTCTEVSGRNCSDIVRLGLPSPCFALTIKCHPKVW